MAMSEWEKELIARARRMHGDFRSDEQWKADQEALFALTPEMAEAIVESVGMMPGGAICGSSMTECEGTVITKEVMAERLARMVRRCGNE